jgi:hypothetical protein
LAVLHAVVLALALGAVVLALLRSFTGSYESAAAAEIGSQLRQFERSAAARPPGQSLQQFSVQFLQTHPLASGDTVVISLAGSGLVVTGSSSPLIREPRVATWITRPPASTLSFSTTVGGVPVEIVGAPIRAGSLTAGTFIAAYDLRPFVAERSRVLVLALAEAGVALLVGVASAFLLLRSGRWAG